MSTDANKKNLVIFSIYFPPEISTASNRLEAFAKYLDPEKFNITVICPETNAEEKFTEINSVDVIRLKNKPHPLKIKFAKSDPFILHKFKALYNRIFNLFIHNEYKHWEKLSIKAFHKINKSTKIDYVISTYPVVAPHLAALKLKNEGCDFKWIADMRDEMSLNPFNNYLKKKYLEKIEQQLFSKANCITTTTPSLVDAFKILAEDNLPVEEIRNGFDFEITDDYNYNETFTITHTGTFYSDIKPYTFLNVLSILHSENRLPEMKVVFIGARNTVIIPPDLKQIVSTTPKIPHHLAEQQIKESDANLLFAPPSISKYLPGKLYEYIASQKPVIAISAADSEASNLINECNAGFIADFNNTNQIKNSILQAYDLWKARKRLKVNLEYFKQYHRKNQVKKLEKLILEKL